MGKYTTYVGMDVHARSVTAKGLDVETGETFSKRFGAGYAAGEIAGWLAKLPQPVYCAYESGCTGVWLARELRALGVDCDVIAVSTLVRSVKDRQQKCDKRDAEAIRDAIANPASRHTVVWIPDETLEGDRELARLRSKASDAAKHAKQELESFLLRHGRVWNERTPTGRPRQPKGAAWERWLDSIEFADETTGAVFEEYRRRERHARDEKARMEALLRELSRKPRNAPVVDALRCLRGVDETTAMTIKAEFGDFERFTGGRKVSSWVGTVPDNRSSGPAERHGAITKAGDKYLRRALVEGVASSATWGPPRTTPPKDAEIPASVLTMVERANERLFERGRHLRGELRKNSNVVKTALASELARWCWAIGREAQRTQAKKEGSA